MKFAVIEFPGSNCDHDAYHATKHVLGQQAEFVWHKETDLRGADVVVLPGGFSYGDYLRTGAIARFSPVMACVCEFAHAGGPVIGICNGFQVLLEVGLLEGALLRNNRLKFLCEHIHVRVEQTDTPFTSGAVAGQVLTLPIAHGEGNFHASPETLVALEANRQVVFRYCAADGAQTDAANPNGSAAGVCGLASDDGRVTIMMPHPERVVRTMQNGDAGIFVSGKYLDRIVFKDG
ncbi:MAG TPA: phosphoribosylformylglycinamidine synthase subunit PurQ, partial [Acidobacteria bacterium]|nr:phosphoribosylformylglycinamidine synthase subunit PurQ [Acidobacteriota bacterium]